LSEEEKGRRISHGRTRKNTEKDRSRNTDKKKKRHFCHGRTRKNTEKDRSRDTEKAEELATDEHGKTRKQQKQRHGRGEEEKTFLPRNDTEKHGISRRIIWSEPEA
jgi:hypothetical protein